MGNVDDVEIADGPGYDRTTQFLEKKTDFKYYEIP